MRNVCKTATFIHVVRAIEMLGETRVGATHMQEPVSEYLSSCVMWVVGCLMYVFPLADATSWMPCSQISLSHKGPGGSCCT